MLISFSDMQGKNTEKEYESEKIIMKKLGCFFSALISVLLILLTVCSDDNSDNNETVASTFAEPAYTENISNAIDAFINITQNAIENGSKENKTEKSDGETEKPTIYNPVSLTSPMTEKFTEMMTAEITSSSKMTERKTVTLSFGEGRSLTEIFEILDEYGVADFDELMKTSETYDYSYYPLVAEIPSDPNRCFKLEGYLFPDTYEFYTNQKPQDVIGKFLRGGKSKITEQMMAQASSLGYTMDEVLTVASIIEKEGAKLSEVSKIAAVIYNRLDAGMKLQMDSSIYYIERHVKPYLSGDINRYNSYYNTYKCAALPAGPISNPGMTTINAALNPADVDYLYFCHDANGKYYYAATYEEHQANLKLAGIE